LDGLIPAIPPIGESVEYRNCDVSPVLDPDNVYVVNLILQTHFVRNIYTNADAGAITHITVRGNGEESNQDQKRNGGV